MSPLEQFPGMHWEEMRARMREGGGKAVAEFISGFSEPLDRLKLFHFAQTSFGHHDWPGKDLDKIVELYHAGIAEALAQAEAADEPKFASRHWEKAASFSFNLAADLAPCWPGDELPRQRGHYEAGLDAATNCLNWRQRLGKGYYPLAVAHWAKGIHQVALGDTEHGVASLCQCHALSIAGAREEGALDTVAPGAEFAVLVSSGYLGLAEWLAGREEGKLRYDAACIALSKTASTPGHRHGARFGLDQLQWAEKRLVKR